MYIYIYPPPRFSASACQFLRDGFAIHRLGLNLYRAGRPNYPRLLTPCRILHFPYFFRACFERALAPQKSPILTAF